jgi:hypothetical protein
MGVGEQPAPQQRGAGCTCGVRRPHAPPAARSILGPRTTPSRSRPSNSWLTPGKRHTYLHALARELSRSRPRNPEQQRELYTRSHRRAQFFEHSFKLRAPDGWERSTRRARGVSEAGARVAKERAPERPPEGCDVGGAAGPRPVRDALRAIRVRLHWYGRGDPAAVSPRRMLSTTACRPHTLSTHALWAAVDPPSAHPLIHSSTQPFPFGAWRHQWSPAKGSFIHARNVNHDMHVTLRPSAKRRPPGEHLQLALRVGQVIGVGHTKLREGDVYVGRADVSMHGEGATRKLLQDATVSGSPGNFLVSVPRAVTTGRCVTLCDVEIAWWYRNVLPFLNGRVPRFRTVRARSLTWFSLHDDATFRSGQFSLLPN